MTIPSRPRFLVEGPASACVISGQYLGWKNCTCLSCAMGLFKSTLGATNISGCEVRRETGDIVGGTTIEQNAAVALAHGVKVEVHTGPNVASPFYLGVQIQAGRGAQVAGNTEPLGKGNVNHNVWANETSGGSMGYPASVLVYDPWSSGPAWWSWGKLITFGRALHPWGEADARTLASLGINGVYAGIYPDTEPHFHSHYGGKQTSPFPDDVFGKKGTTDAQRTVRTGPGTQYPAIRVLAVGARFGGYQWVSGGPAGPAGDWYGDHNGHYWISTDGVSGRGS